MKPSQNQNEQNLLRKKAEVRLARAPMKKISVKSAEALLHELRVHQIELEMQNEELRRAQVALEESRDHYIEFYDFAPVGYITLTDKGLIEEINLTGAAMFGMERNKLLHQRFAHFIVPKDNDHYHQYFVNLLKSDEKKVCELLLKRGDGSSFPAQLDCIRLNREGKSPLVRIVLNDITERKEIDEVVREQEEFFRLIAENTEDFIAVLDLEGRRLYNNPAYGRLFGDIEKLKGTDSFAEIHPDDREHVKRIFHETVQSGSGLSTNFRFVLPDGSIRYMESHGGLIRNTHGQPMRVVVVSRDVTARKKAEDIIRKLAFYDELTNQANRRLLFDRLMQSMAASKRSGQYGALLFLDLDNFKPLNDRYGHAAGDLLLVEAAHRISRCVREVDTVSRFGGDEFVILLSELEKDKKKSIAEAGFVAEKIRVALAEPYFLKIQLQDKSEIGVEHHCTSSIGVVLFNDHEARAEDFIKWADMAMYQAKKDGRNRVRFFDPDAFTESRHGLPPDA